MNKENDHSGLIYGMGHAVYTLSDPRAVQLKKSALKLAKGTEVKPVPDFSVSGVLLPAFYSFAKNKGDIKTMCANVDMYSDLVSTKVLSTGRNVYRTDAIMQECPAGAHTEWKK